MKKVHFITKKELSKTSLKRIYEIAKGVGPVTACCFKRKRSRETIKVEKLKAHQKQYLKELAMPLPPVFFIGNRKLSSVLMAAIDEALDVNELIKLKFLTVEEKESAIQMCGIIGKKVECELVELARDHTATFFRRNQKTMRQKIKLP